MTVVAEARVVGDWLLEERIGGGGQAVVYRARHVGPGGVAAVKVFHRSVWADPAFRVRFRRECEALSALHHANIVPIRDCGEAGGRGFLAMGLARGGTLGARLAAGPMPAADALALLEGIADGLDAAHRAGLVHRDVTPSNILLDPDGPWLADFGIARRVDTTTITADGLLVGTAGYLAPEVIAGERATAASDRYGLAAVAFQALAGRPPFEAEALAGLLYAHVNRTAPLLSSVRPGLPRGLDAAMARSLAKDPRERPRTAAEVVEGLERALRGDVDEPTRVMARPRRRRRRRLRAGTLALCAVALIGAGGATVAVTASLMGDSEGTAASPAPAPAPPPLTVPGPDGEVLAATPAASDLPGIAAGARAASATVGDVTVAAVPGGWTELEAALDDLRGSFHGAERLEADGETVGLTARIPTDLAGLADRWVLMAVEGPDGPRAVVLHGPGSSAEDYGRALAARADQRVVPVPEGLLPSFWG